MSPSGTQPIQRMRPALGTFVEISAAGRPPDQLIAAIDRAFADIARVEQLMSFHRPESDIGRINRSHGAIEIHPWTARVLRLALRLAQTSAHRFNPTVGGELVARGRLPDPATAFIASGHADDIRLEGTRLQRLRPVLITLDGIAKGWAVDRAIARLKACGVSDAVVNAGGDWRCFGTPRVIRLDSNAGCIALGQLTNGACATSAAGRNAQDFPAQLIAGSEPVRYGQWTVIARYAWLADALTKVAAATANDEAPKIIRRLGGQLLEPVAPRQPIHLDDI